MVRTLPHRRLGFKLVFGMILILSVVIGTTGVISLRTAGRQFEHLLFQEFLSTRNVAVNFLAFVEQTSLIVARSVAHEKDLVDLWSSGASAETLTAELAKLADKHAADVLVLLDMNGRILAQSDTMERTGNRLISLDIIKQAIRGMASNTAIVQDRENFILYGTFFSKNPATGEQVIVMAGYALNNDFVDHIQENSHIEISLVRERSVIASTLRKDGARITVIPIPYLEYRRILHSPDAATEMNFLGEDYWVSAIPLPGMQANMSGSILLVHAQHELKSSRRALISRYVILFLSSLVVGSVLAVFISRSILRPVRDISLATGRLAAGDYTSRIVKCSADELGQMAEHFNQMAETIQIKNDELQGYSQGLERQVQERTAEIAEQSLLIDNILVSSQDLGIGATDLGLTVSYFNPAAERILGVPAHEAKGRSILHLFDRDSGLEARLKRIMSEVKEKGFHNFDFDRLFGGERQYLEGQVVAMRHGSGELTGFVFMVRDVTSARHLEERVRKAERFSAFSNLAGGLAHDLNNLLQAIMGNISLAEDAAGFEEAKISLGQASKATNEASRLGQRLLQLSNITLMDTGVLDTRALLSRITAKVRSDSFDLIVDVPSDLWPVSGSVDLLEEAIGNVLDNAIEAVSEGGCIAVTAENFTNTDKATDSGSGVDQVKITITDDGRGIPLDDLSRIFDPYFSTKALDSIKGRGLNLATSMATIKKHNGHIHVESTEGRGTSFFIFLPV